MASQSCHHFWHKLTLCFWDKKTKIWYILKFINIYVLKWGKKIVFCAFRHGQFGGHLLLLLEQHLGPVSQHHLRRKSQEHLLTDGQFTKNTTLHSRRIEPIKVCSRPARRCTCRWDWDRRMEHFLSPCCQSPSTANQARRMDCLSPSTPREGKWRKSIAPQDTISSASLACRLCYAREGPNQVQGKPIRRQRAALRCPSLDQEPRLK